MLAARMRDVADEIEVVVERRIYRVPLNNQKEPSLGARTTASVAQ
jgi:hypothetical protein